MNCSIDDLINDSAIREKINFSDYVTQTVGLPTLMDIKAELSKPGRDPRKQFEAFNFAEGINKITDLHVGMELPGVATNITAFGVFVDVGVHQDGLVHISELADKFVSDPADIVKVNQKVKVRILEIDIPRKRISMSMKKEVTPGDKKEAKQKSKPKKPAPAKKKPDNNTPLGETLGLKLTFGS